LLPGAVAYSNPEWCADLIKRINLIGSMHSVHIIDVGSVRVNKHRSAQFTRTDRVSSLHFCHTISCILIYALKHLKFFLFPTFYRKNGEKIIQISNEKWLDVYGKVKRSVCRAFFISVGQDYLK
jgi:hypothetical protein